MFEIDWRTPHLWAQTSKEPVRARSALTGEHHADVAIVGGGYTGLSTALSLAEAGLRTIVIEANAIGSAASGRNNGLVIPHHSKRVSYRDPLGAGFRARAALQRSRARRCA